MDEIRLAGIGSPGEDVHGDTATDHSTGEFVDVDVHAAGITRTGLLQGAGV